VLQVSTGFVYDHKASWSAKTGFGSVGGVATYATKDGSTPVEAKLGYKVDAATGVEFTVTDNGKLTAVANKDNLLAGLKAKLTSVLAGGPNDTSLGLTYGFSQAPLVGGKSTVVADIGLAGSKSGKLGASLGWSPSSTLLLGCDAEYDTSKAAVTKYSLGAQAALSNGGTAVLVLADKAGTLKASYTHKCSATVNGGFEAVHKLEKGDTSFGVGMSKRLDGGSAKAHATSAGIVSLLLSKDVQPNKVSATLSLQMDATNMAKAPKVGVQVSVK
jgi:hypothetical protein